MVNFASGIWHLSLLHIPMYFIFLMHYECSSLSVVTFLVSKFVLYDRIEPGYCSYDCMAYLFPVVNNPPASIGNARNARSTPCVGKIPWCRKWQPTSVSLPGKYHEQRGLEGYSSWTCKELDVTERLSVHAHMHFQFISFVSKACLLWIAYSCILPFGVVWQSLPLEFLIKSHSMELILLD